MPNETIGERLKRLRANHVPKMSQSKLSKAMQVSRETINHWENDTREIKASQVRELADIFHVTCDYILKGVSTVNVDINRETGLSETSIHILKNISDGHLYKLMNEANGLNSIDVVNFMISDKTFLPRFICQLSDYFYERHSEETKTKRRSLIGSSDAVDIAMYRLTKIMEQLAEDAYDYFYTQAPTKPRRGKKWENQEKLLETLEPPVDNED